MRPPMANDRDCLTAQHGSSPDLTTGRTVDWFSFNAKCGIVSMVIIDPDSDSGSGADFSLRGVYRKPHSKIIGADGEQVTDLNFLAVGKSGRSVWDETRGWESYTFATEHEGLHFFGVRRGTRFRARDYNVRIVEAPVLRERLGLWDMDINSIKEGCD